MKRTLKWLVGLAVIIGLIVAAGQILVDTEINGRLAYEPVYRATTRIQVSLDTPLPGVEQDEWIMNQVDALEHQIMSRQALEQVTIGVGLTRGFPRWADGEFTAEGEKRFKQFIDGMSDSVIVTREHDSPEVRILAISVVHQDAKLAAKLANRFAENAVSDISKRVQQRLIAQKQFFEREVERWWRKVSEVESAEFRFALKMKGVMPDDPRDAHDRLNALQAERDEKAEELQALRTELEAMIDQHDAQPDVIKQRIVVEDTRLAELKEQRRALLDLYLAQLDETDRPPDDPTMIELRARIDQTGKQIKSLDGEPRFKEIERPNVEKRQLAEQIAARRDEVEARADALHRIGVEVEKYEVLNRNFFAIRHEYARIRRELAEAREKLAFWDEQLQRATLTATVELAERGVTMAVIERATPYQDPMTLSERRAWRRDMRAQQAARRGWVLPWSLPDEEDEDEEK